MTQLRFDDNTKLSTHRRCSRKYFFRHYLNLRGKGLSPELAFGLGWHGAMDVVWKEIAEGNKDDTAITKKAFLEGFHTEWVGQGFPSIQELTDEQIEDLNPRTPMTALGMLDNYVKYARPIIEGELRPLAIEQPFAVPLSDRRPDLWYCGRLDKVVEDQSGGVYILDHKTTSAYKKDGYFKSSFVDSFSPNSQVEGYSYQARIQYGDKFRGVYIDAALVHKTVHEGFKLLPVLLSDNPLEQWLWETKNEVELIERYEHAIEHDAHSDEALKAFPRNTEACFDYGRACPYLDFCKAGCNPLQFVQDDEPPDGFVYDKWDPFDVNEISSIMSQSGEVK